MAYTENLGLNVISESDNMSVSDFFQKLAGNGENGEDSNMMMLDKVIQDLIDNKLSLSGGEMTGELTLSGDPTEDGHAVNKGYVDTLIGDIASLLDSINGEVV